MSYWLEKLERLEGQQKEQEPKLEIGSIPNMPISEFEARDLAVEVYSEILGSTVWLCSNEKMVRQIREDNPEAVCYTARELKELIEMNPESQSLKNMNDIKATFPSSTVIEAKSKDELLDRTLAEMSTAYPAGFYVWLDSHRELFKAICEAENRVNEIYKSGSYSELETAVTEYQDLHMEAFKKMKEGHHGAPSVHSGSGPRGNGV